MGFFAGVCGAAAGAVLPPVAMFLGSLAGSAGARMCQASEEANRFADLSGGALSGALVVCAYDNSTFGTAAKVVSLISAPLTAAYVASAITKQQADQNKTVEVHRTFRLKAAQTGPWVIIGTVAGTAIGALGSYALNPFVGACMGMIVSYTVAGLGSVAEHNHAKGNNQFLSMISK